MADHKNEENINDVLGQVGYQMNEIMTTMYASIQRVLPTDSPAKSDEIKKMEKYAALLMQDFYRLRRLAQNLSEAAELNHPMYLSKKNDDIVGLCRTIVTCAGQSAEMLGLHLEFHCERASYIIAVDVDRIKRLILNLLSNSFKFTPQGGCIKVEVNIKTKYVEIRVSDTGCGIAPEDVDKIFEKYQYSILPDGSPSGLGLGLPICRKIAQEHGGGLVILSHPGEGTTVVVTLKNEKESQTTMGTKLTMDSSGGFNMTLQELSDVIPSSLFRSGVVD
ncbi:MAG: hypothetical protein IKC03_04135 [Oscillospiraceae bacterium]|nr:hypothetical protein [Oscillospiraceae bacterium]